MTASVHSDPDMRPPAALRDRRAVVVGGTAGIGLAIATAMAAADASVTLVGRDTARGHKATEDIARQAIGAAVAFVRADACDPRALSAAMDAIAARSRGIDVLVHCVGGYFTPSPFESTTVEVIDSKLRSHLASAMYTVHAALPHMIRAGGGCILTVASDAAKTATPGESVIGAAKAAVAMFSRTLALEVARHGIRVNCLTPSIVRGTLTYDRLMADPFSRKLFEKAERRARLGVVTPEDIAPLAVFLASDGAARITGQTISINGGISAA